MRWLIEKELTSKKTRRKHDELGRVLEKKPSEVCQ